MIKSATHVAVTIVNDTNIVLCPLLRGLQKREFLAQMS